MKVTAKPVKEQEAASKVTEYVFYENSKIRKRYC